MSIVSLVNRSNMQKKDGEVSVQANDILHRWTLSTTWSQVTRTQINVKCEMWKKTYKTEIWCHTSMNFIFKPFESIQFITACVLVQTGVGQNAKASTPKLDINSICWWDCIDEYFRPVSPVSQNMTIAKYCYCKITMLHSVVNLSIHKLAII